MRFKNMDINNFKKRSDYNQTFTMINDTFQELKACMHKIFCEQGEILQEKRKQEIESSKINW